MTTAPLRQGMLCKRAQGKSTILGRTNWRDRFFVLLPEEVSYWEGFGGPSNSKATCKGRISIPTVRAVEEVTEDCFQRPNMMQVVYDLATLYIQASDAQDRADWLLALRKACSMNSCLADRYHPGNYDGKWACCAAPYRSAAGCCPCYDYTTLLNPSPPAADPLPASPVAATSPGIQERALPAPPAASTAPAATQDHTAQPPPSPTTAAPPDALFEVQAIFHYQAVEADDLGLREGERLYILECTEEHWWLARKVTTGQTGVIPANYVRRTGLEAEPWFHGRMSRSEAGQRLKVVNQEGCFLVRESESKPGEYSLSVSHGESLRHYHIKNADGLFLINERHQFPSISQLIEYHKLNSGGLVTRLRKSLADVNAPVTAGLGHAKWEINPAEIQLGRELGSGQFGVVREGLYKNSKRVAVKMMKKGAMSEDDFISEAQVMKNFRHPNLVQLYGVCTKERPIFLVTELMDQGNLLDYMRKNQKLNLQPDVLHYMSIQVCKAMEYLELRKFIHRDLAARNCLVGEGYIVKVADFGLARYVLDDEYMASEGTKFPIKWAAPEVIDYARFSTKSDVWSYGILLWEIWTLGRTPYPSFSNVEVVQKVVEGYRLGRPDIATHEMHQLMLDCWHQDPEFRPGFADIKMRLEERGTDYADAFD